jgi:hypothetical protein
MAAIGGLQQFPAELRRVTGGLSATELATPYRDGGWTVAQVVHHVADSHALGFARFKHGLTESCPAVNPYDQDAWAALADTRLPIDVSVRWLDALHARWSELIVNLADADFARLVRLPRFGEVPLDFVVHLYDWHGRHHLGHINRVRQSHLRS